MPKSNNLQRAMGVLVTLILILVAPKICFALTQEEAKAYIYDHIQSEFGYDLESYEFINFYCHAGHWAFSVELKEHPTDQDGLIVGSVNEKGKLIEIRGPENIVLDRQIEISLKNCFRDSQGIEKMFAFKQKWNPVIQAMVDAGIAIADIPVFEKYLGVISMDIDLPAEGDITREEAFAKAKVAIGALSGWTEDKVDFFNVIIEVYHTPKASDINTPVYHFLYYRYSKSDKQFEGPNKEQTYTAYEKELYAAFGGDNVSTPAYISVMIDARTGKAVEEPIVTIPPVDRHYLDFILR